MPSTSGKTKTIDQDEQQSEKATVESRLRLGKSRTVDRADASKQPRVVGVVGNSV